MPTQEQMQTAAQAVIDDSATMHAIVHGASDDPDVETEGGNVPPLAKQIANMAIPTFANEAAAVAFYAATGKVFYNTATGHVEVTAREA